MFDRTGTDIEAGIAAAVLTAVVDSVAAAATTDAVIAVGEAGSHSPGNLKACHSPGSTGLYYSAVNQL